MAARIPAEERLTNLVVALMATEIGLTKQQILASVSGYRQRAEGKADALDKMFERDKEELRALGIPIETLGDHADPNDLREARYRIPKAEYDLPVDIEFPPAALAVLRLAGDRQPIRRQRLSPERRPRMHTITVVLEIEEKLAVTVLEGIRVDASAELGLADDRLGAAVVRQ